MPDADRTLKIIRTHRKTVALIIEPDGSLVVRAPLNYPRQRIHEILKNKAEWIRAKQEEMRNRQVHIPPHRFQEGETFLYIGNAYALQVVPHAQTPLVLGDRFYLDQRYLHQAPQVLETWYRCQARKVFEERLAALAMTIGINYNRMRLSSARTRWGSCSSRGTISLAWRLVMAPLPVIDYILAHELTHLRIPNHSKTFWSQVASVMPDYRTQSNWLKEFGHTLRL